jgi:hypothetical protein
MNAKLLIAVASFAAIASGVARADEADASQFAVKFEGSRTRAEVMAEAATVAKSRSTEPAGSRVAPALQSKVEAQAVRAQALQAARLGQTSRGEI